MQISRKVFLALLAAVLALTALPACSAKSNEGHLNMTPMDKMPAQVQSAPVTVQQGYQFVSANPELMKSIPCYCGCGDIGHTSNYACYISGVDDKGNFTFDSHALGCSICIDITQDAMRMSRGGRSPQDIRAYVDTTYFKYGPSNIP